MQLALGAAFIFAWQYVPTLSWLTQHVKFLDPFFISSPTAVWQNVVDLTVGQHTTKVVVWPYLATTVTSALGGAILGLLLGACFGLVFSNSPRLSEVVRPYIILANTVPRIAIIPIFVVIAGPSLLASVISVVVVVFFIGFFNAFEGGRSINSAVLENAQLLGAGPWELMRSIRLPMVLIWTFAAVPNAISFGLIVAVTAELLSGVQGMGALLQVSMVSIQAGLTFAIIVILSSVGLILYWGAMLLRKLIIRWEQ